MLKNLSKLFNRQHDWLPHTLQNAFYPHEAHRVALIREQLASHRAVEDDPHLILQVSLALWREVEPLEPLLDGQWLNFLQRVLAPLRYDVVPQPRPIASRSRMTVWQLFREIPLDHSTKGHYNCAWTV
jgi:hypothetical protein